MYDDDDDALLYNWAQLCNYNRRAIRPKYQCLTTGWCRTCNVEILVSRRRRALQLRQQYDSVTQYLVFFWNVGKSVIHIPHRCKQFTRTPGRQGYVCLCTRTHAEQVRSVNHTKFDSLSHDISRSKPSSPTSTKADRQQDATRRWRARGPRHRRGLACVVLLALASAVRPLRLSTCRNGRHTLSPNSRWQRQ